MTSPIILQAIITKFIGPTNTRGSRIKATCAAGTMTVHYKSELNVEQNHIRAAQELAEKFGWKSSWYAGGMPDDAGFVFVQQPLGEGAAVFCSGVKWE